MAATTKIIHWVSGIEMRQFMRKDDVTVFVHLGPMHSVANEIFNKSDAHFLMFWLIHSNK